jgi:hypothetical protein
VAFPFCPDEKRTRRSISAGGLDRICKLYGPLTFAIDGG